ncbi:hypothetical protein BJX96DRAFT_151966 [Aspergillus floccosus]
MGDQFPADGRPLVRREISKHVSPQHQALHIPFVSLTHSRGKALQLLHRSGIDHSHLPPCLRAWSRPVIPDQRRPEMVNAFQVVNQLLQILATHWLGCNGAANFFAPK